MGVIDRVNPIVLHYLLITTHQSHLIYFLALAQCVLYHFLYNHEV